MKSLKNNMVFKNFLDYHIFKLRSNFLKIRLKKYTAPKHCAFLPASSLKSSNRLKPIRVGPFLHILQGVT